MMSREETRADDKKRKISSLNDLKSNRRVSFIRKPPFAVGRPPEGSQRAPSADLPKRVEREATNSSNNKLALEQNVTSLSSISETNHDRNAPETQSHDDLKSMSNDGGDGVPVAEEEHADKSDELSQRSSSVTLSEGNYPESDATSSMHAVTLSGSTTSYYTNTSYSTMSGPSRSSRSDLSVRTATLRRSATQQSLLGGDNGSRLLKMAMKREWTQLELTLRYMNKSDPCLYAVDDESGINPLMLAARDNRIVVVERLIDMGVNINDRARDGQSAIHFAVANGREEIVNILLKKKVDLTAKGGDKEHLPLHVACFRSGNNAVSIAQSIVRATNKNLRMQPDKEGNIALFLAIDANNQGAYRELLVQCADEQLRYQNPSNGNSVLHLACERRDAEMTRHFAKRGSPVNLQNNGGSTPLHIAASMGDVLIVECLYTNKADASLLDNHDRSPLHLAAEKGHTAVVEFLADRFPKSVLRRTADGSTLMHIASEHGHPDTAMAFLKKGVPLHMPNKSGAVCLHSAAKNNHVDVVRALLSKGAHIDAMTKDKLTALHVAVKFCRPLVVQMLLGLGAPVEMKGGEKQETPLHLASQIPDGDLVAEMLLKSGADANSARDDGETPMHMAARGGNLKTFELLLREGGDSRTPSKAGENALHIAVRHCRSIIVSFLLEFLATNFSRYEATMCVNMENKEGETPVHLAAELTKERARFDGEEAGILQLLLRYGGDVNFCTRLTQETALHYCARAGNRASLEVLLAHVGKNQARLPSVINRQAKNGWSPLLFASDEGHAALVDVLLQHSARVDVFDENGKAALHLAAENGFDVIADMLLRKKAFVNAKTKLGLTPLHLSAQRGYNNLVKMLIRPTASEQTATVDALSLDKKTPLHKASEDGKIDVCETLLHVGADVEARDSTNDTPGSLSLQQGQTPLHLAAENDHSDVVKMFLAHRRDLVTKANKNGATCAHIAAEKGSVAVIRELLKSNKESVTTATNTDSHSTALHIAATRGHSEVVRELILNEASITEEDAEGMNALHLSAKHGHTNIIEVITSSRAAIEAKTKLQLVQLWQTTSSKSGFNALHIATRSGHENFAREMLRRIRAAEPSQLPGVKIDDAKNSAKDSASRNVANLLKQSHHLHRFVFTMSDAWPRLRHTASSLSKHGFTPLHLASQSGHVNLVRMILNYPGVSVEASTAVHKLTPLHLAAKSGFVAVVGLLLSKSIEQLRCTDARGYTCLHYAAVCGHLDMASLLFGQGAHLEARDNDGLTPLHLAAKSGSLKMVKLLTEAGASTRLETKHDKRIAIQYAASSRHYDVTSFLLKCDFDAYKLIEDKSFVTDLMLVATSPVAATNNSRPFERAPLTNMDILEEFVLSSPAPLDAAAKLSRAFAVSSNRDKEQARGLLECADYCESLAVELLEICSAANGANDILQATDPKSNPFLDVLIESEQKSVIANPAVQKYLSDIWVGSLKWSDWKLVLLFFAILFIPALWLVLAFPLQWRLNRTPIIKFIVYLVSHFYMVSLFVMTVAIPVRPIFEQGDLIPGWNEWLLLVWVSGVLVYEITSPGRRTGIAQLRAAVLVLCAIAVVVHLIAIAFPYSDTDVLVLNQRLEIIYIRNILLSAAMTFAFVQFLEFLSFHYLFGPWSIIIEGLLNDLIKFGVIVLMFIMAFTMWLAAVYQPVYVYQTNETAIVGGGGGGGGARVLNPLDTFQILFFALFGLIEPDNLPPINRNPLATIYLIQIVFGIYHIITLIVLINLLIAMMSDTYQRIQAQSDTEWKFGRAKLIRNMKNNSLSPAPVNLLVTAYQYVKLLLKQKSKACDVGISHVEEYEVDGHSSVEGKRIKNAQRSLAKRQSKVQGGLRATSSGDKRNLHHMAEAGTGTCSLEQVVDWKRISLKYLEKKGKQKATTDIFSTFDRDGAASERRWSDEHREATRPNTSSYGDVDPDRIPHTVPYGDAAM